MRTPYDLVPRRPEWRPLPKLPIPGRAELILYDLKTDQPVTHRDVGTGLSQVMPILAAAYGLRDYVIAIEQPEIHIHPRMQAALADVFIESALGDRQPASRDVCKRPGAGLSSIKAVQL